MNTEYQRFIDLAKQAGFSNMFSHDSDGFEIEFTTEADITQKMFKLFRLASVPVVEPAVPSLTIKFTENLSKGYVGYGPVFDLIVAEARAQRWSGSAGFKEYAKEEYKAILRCGKHGNWTSIKFADQANYDRFMAKVQAL